LGVLRKLVHTVADRVLNSYTFTASSSVLVSPLSVQLYSLLLVLNTKHLISKHKKYVVGENCALLGNYTAGSGDF